MCDVCGLSDAMGKGIVSTIFCVLAWKLLLRFAHHWQWRIKGWGPNWGPKGRKQNFFGNRAFPLSRGLDDRPASPPPLSECLDPPLISSISSWAVLTLYRIVFARTWKSYWVGLLFSHKNGDFGAKSVKGGKLRRAVTLKLDHHISDRFVPLFFTVWTGIRTATRVNY